MGLATEPLPEAGPGRQFGARWGRRKRLGACLGSPHRRCAWLAARAGASGGAAGTGTEHRHRALRAAAAGRQPEPEGQAGGIMTEPSSRKEGFKKCRSATFSIDGYSFTIGEPDLIPPLSFISLFVPSPQLQRQLLLTSASCRCTRLQCMPCNFYPSFPFCLLYLLLSKKVVSNTQRCESLPGFGTRRRLQNFLVWSLISGTPLLSGPQISNLLACFLPMNPGTRPLGAVVLFPVFVCCLRECFQIP